VEFKEIILEKSEGIATMTLNRPDKLNAISAEMGLVWLPRLLRQIQEDDEVRVLVITGAGRGFCAGGDVNALASLSDLSLSLTRQQRLQALGAFARDLYDLEKPVIAAVNGVAAGGGVSLALLSDIRIASENARFGLSFISRGLIPDCGATFLLPRLLGTGKSFQLMYTGDLIDASEAERIGLVDMVFPHDRFMDEAMQLAGRLAKAPPLAMAQIRRAVHSGLLNDLEQQLYFETYAQSFLFGTKDFVEGINAFLQKREPEFGGE